MPTLRPLALVLALALLPLLAACGGGGGTSDGTLPPPIDPGTMSASERAYAEEVLRLVNLERAGNGLSALAWHEEAAQVAYVHDVDMDQRNFFSHINPDGDSPLDRVVAAGITGFSSVGENIARGQTSPAQVMSDWMNSTGHRANILNAGFTHLGVGVHGAGDIWWTQVFLRMN